MPVRSKFIQSLIFKDTQKAKMAFLSEGGFMIDRIGMASAIFYYQVIERNNLTIIPPSQVYVNL